MDDDDLALVVRQAITAAGESWRTQPSILRRRVELALGSDLPAHRSQVHLLVAAVEERVPTQLTRYGAADAQRRDLAAELSATRGWTAEASTWAVSFWATVLGLESRPGTTLLPPLPLDDSQEPSTPPAPEPESQPEPEPQPVAVAPGSTLLPPPPPPGGSAPCPAPPPTPPPPSAAADVTTTGPATGTARAKARKRMEAFLGRPVDAAYEGYRSSPAAIVGAIVALVLSGAVTCLGVLLASMPVVWVGVVPMTVSAIALPLARRRIPVVWVAVAGDQVSVLSTVRDATNAPTATGVAFEGTLADVRPVEGSTSAVTIGTEPVWFLRSRQRAVAELLRGAA